MDIIIIAIFAISFTLLALTVKWCSKQVKKND